jgi:nucleoid-associated protein YgaU
LVLTGQGKANMRINLYVDNQLVGQPRVRRDQSWHLSPKNYQCDVGEHSLRADLVDADGQVQSRVELPFERQPTSWDTLGKVDLTIRRNDNLWTIASRAFGEGVKYTLIYENNNDQISDPNLIYPGQVFEIKREN